MENLERAGVSIGRGGCGGIGACEKKREKQNNGLFAGLECVYLSRSEFMNVVTEESDKCQVVLRVEVPAEKVNAEWKKVLSQFVSSAKMPGFRPGKAPASLFESKYADEIRGQVIGHVIDETLGEVIKEKALDVLEVSEVEEPELGKDRVLKFVAHLLVAPKIDLPDYENVEVPMDDIVVTDEHLQMSLDELRKGYATYEPVEGRALAMGDFSVVTYSAKLDGVPLKEAFPSAPPVLSGKTNFWLALMEASLLPGFCAELVGLEVGAKKEFPIVTPEDFPINELAGKKLEYEVEVIGNNQKVLPEWDDELVGKFAEGKSLAEFREMVKGNLEKGLEERVANLKFETMCKHLLDSTSFEVPEGYVEGEANQNLQKIVQENLGRGVSESLITQNEGNIRQAAYSNADQSVRLRFLLMAIGQKEGVKVEEKDLLEEIYIQAMSRQMDPQKFADEIRKNKAIKTVRDGVLFRKTVSLLVDKVKLVPPQKTEA